jgi:uracil-DNA glycosylase family 4
MAVSGPSEPPSDCAKCERLVELRHSLQQEHPSWHNAPVPSFGDPAAALLIVGLAPGLQGANRTGRPFTGDYAGDLLYATLGKLGLSEGRYDCRPDDGLRLSGCMITNAVRCLPPQNKPVGAEINNCRPFLQDQISEMGSIKAILALGKIAHDSVVRTLGAKLKDHKFAHAAVHQIENEPTLVDSYHCSRYNTNTRRLTEDMFEQAVATAKNAAGL